MTNVDTEALRALAIGATPGPWKACKEGACKCGQVWSTPKDSPIIECLGGDWGDTYAAIRQQKDTGSIEGKYEAYIEMAVYGHIPREAQTANAAYIAAANPSAILALLDENAALRAEVERARAESDKIVRVSGFGVNNTSTTQCDYMLVGVTQSGKVVMSNGDGRWCDVSPSPSTPSADGQEAV